jgi:mannosyltransferase
MSDPRAASSARSPHSVPVGARARRFTSTAEWAVLLAVLGLGVWTRLHDLAAESVWIDEAITRSRASLPIDALITSSVNKNHVPSYFVLMHYVLPFGDDEWMLRLPSAIFGILKLALLAGAGFIVGGVRAAIAAALLLALSPGDLRYDQEARMYAMQTFGTCLALVGQLWLLAHPSDAVHCLPGARGNPSFAVALGRARCAWSAWIAGVVVALYAHNTSALYLVASSGATLVLLVVEPMVRWRFFWHWSLANVIVLLAWAPWLPTLLSQFHKPEFVYNNWGRMPDLRAVATQASGLMLGGRSLPLSLLRLGLLVGGVWQLRRRPAILGALLFLSTSALGLFWLVSLKKPMFIPRLMLWGSAASCVLGACGILLLRRTWLQTLALVLLTVLGLRALHQNYYARSIKTDWRGAARILSGERGRDTIVLAASFKEIKSIKYYAERKSDPLVLPSIYDADVMRLHTLKRLLQRARRLVFVRAEKAAGQSASMKLVRRRARLLSSTDLGRVIIERYEFP